MDSAAIKVEGHGTTRVARRADVPSLWLVVGFLLLQQLVLTLIHYGLCPALGIGLLSAGSVIVTIIGASAIMLAIVAMDFRRPGRARAVLATIPRWDRSTVVVMLAGMAIAQLPLVYLAVSGKTVWQSGPGSHLAVGEALRTSLATICGLGVLLATVIVAPIVEELLYRGYLLGSLVGRVPPVAIHFAFDFKVDAVIALGLITKNADMLGQLIVQDGERPSFGFLLFGTLRQVHRIDSSIVR